MHNVDFPVFGIDNKGNSAIMYPEKEYQFAGEYVFEYPLKKRGMNTWYNQTGAAPSASSNAGAYAAAGQAAGSLFSTLGNIWSTDIISNAQKDIASSQNKTNIITTDMTNTSKIKIEAGHDAAAKYIAQIQAATQASKPAASPMNSDTILMGAVGLVMVVAVIGLFSYAKNK